MNQTYYILASYMHYKKTIIQQPKFLKIKINFLTYDLLYAFLIKLLVQAKLFFCINIKKKKTNQTTVDSKTIPVYQLHEEQRTVIAYSKPGLFFQVSLCNLNNSWGRVDNLFLSAFFTLTVLLNLILDFPRFLFPSDFVTFPMPGNNTFGTVVLSSYLCQYHCYNLFKITQSDIA